MAQEATKDNPEMEQLRDQVELAKKKLECASTEYKRLRETQAKAQEDNIRLVGDCKAATNYYKAMKDARGKMELMVGAKMKEAQAAKDKTVDLATKLGVAHAELEEINKQLSLNLNKQNDNVQGLEVDLTSLKASLTSRDE